MFVLRGEQPLTKFFCYIVGTEMDLFMNFFWLTEIVFSGNDKVGNMLACLLVTFKIKHDQHFSFLFWLWTTNVALVTIDQIPLLAVPTVMFTALMFILFTASGFKILVTFFTLPETLANTLAYTSTCLPTSEYGLELMQIITNLGYEQDTTIMAVDWIISCCIRRADR